MTHRRRSAAYLAALALLGGYALFAGLGAPHMRGDEELYGRVVDRMLATGDWVAPSLTGRQPIDKPPLYFWLTAATKGLVPDLEAGYRVWAAAFGLGSVLLACALGSLLFAPEVGLAAGLLLTLNRGWLFHETHGPRRGVLDSGLTFLLILTAFLACRAPRMRRPWLGWLGAGLAAAAMSLLKPLLGFPVLGLLALHELIYGAARPWWRRLQGPLLAGAIAVLALLPWNLAMVGRYGREVLGKLYLENSVRLAIEGVSQFEQGPLYYWWQATLSSEVFWLFLPALAACVVLGWRERRDRGSAYGLLVLLIVGWIGLFSPWKSKPAWYAFPVFPLIALAIAAAGGRFLGWLARRHGPATPARAPAWKIGLLLLAVGGPWVGLRSTLAIAREVKLKPYQPWEIYQSTVAGARPETRFLLVHFPGLPKTTRGFYIEKMDRAQHSSDPAELAALTGEAFERRLPLVLIASDATPPTLLAEVEELVHSPDTVRIDAAEFTFFGRGVYRDLPGKLKHVARFHSYPGYSPGSELRFGSPAAGRYLKAGWSKPRRGWRWLRRRQGTVLFSVNEIEPLRLRFAGRTDGDVPLEVKLNGQVVAVSRALTSRRSVLEVDLPVSAMQRRNRLDFRLADEVEIPGGLFGRSLRLEPVDSGLSAAAP